MNNLERQPEDLAGHGQEYHTESKAKEYEMQSDVTLDFDHQYMPVEVINKEGKFYTVRNEHDEIFMNCEPTLESDGWTSLRLPHINNLPASYLFSLYMEYGSDMNNRYRGCMLFSDLKRELNDIQKQKFKLKLMEKSEELKNDLYETKYGEKEKINKLETKIRKIDNLIKQLN